MGTEGWYYLHENGQLIYKKDYDGVVADLRESEFVRALWPCDPSSREGAWSMLVEALAIGADRTRVLELANRWGCGDEDAKVYADRIGVTLTQDGNAICATGPMFTNIEEAPAGFGDTALESMADFCKQLGFSPNKLNWHADFKQLVQALGRGEGA